LYNEFVQFEILIIPTVSAYLSHCNPTTSLTLYQ
jgi:hypothetical protein